MILILIKINQFSYCLLYRMEDDWQLPQKKQYPLSISFSPQMKDSSETFINPFLGYPNSPIIGRYNRGQYKIGETLFQIEFRCTFNKDLELYSCGQRPLALPQSMLEKVRNIPEIICNNKAAGIKNSPQYLPQRYPVLDTLSIYWIISFGDLGKDFLNYLNHMYILANTLFQQNKLPRMVHYLPIYAYLPQSSGLHEQEVERGLGFGNYRGEYMSFHLNKGAPAFSPNNMRLGVKGGQLVSSKNNQKQKQTKKGGKTKYIPKEKAKQLQKQLPKQQKKLQSEQEQSFNIGQLEEQSQNKFQLPVKGKNINKQYQKQAQQKHQGFIHFYTSVLLQSDYRVYYHWHIEYQNRAESLRQILKYSNSIQQFVDKYKNLFGADCLYQQISRLLFPFKQ